MTALVLRRGTVVALLAAFACAALSVALFAVGVLLAERGGVMAGVSFVPFTIAIFGTTPAIVSALLAAFARSLERPPRFGDVMKRALGGALTVFGMAMLTIVPGTLVGTGIGLFIAMFRERSVETPPVVVFVLFLLVALSFVLMGVWTFGRYILIGAVAFFVDHPGAAKRSYVVFLDPEIKGHEVVILLTGAVPLVGVISVVGQGLIPAIALPPELSAVFSCVAGVAIAIGTVAVATAAYAVIDAPVRIPPMRSEPVS